MDKLIEYIQGKWICTPERYPEMSMMNSDEQLRFVLRHTALHFAKTAGKVAAISQNSDHGELLNVEDLKINTAKSLINTLYLAGQLKMTEQEIVSMVKKIIDNN